MRKRIVYFLVFLCLMAYSVPSVATAQNMEVPKTVNLQALLEIVKLNKGKVVIVNFFATWCPPCKEEIPGLVGIAKTYPADKVAVIGVSVDQKAALVPAFLKPLHVNYPIFHAGNDVATAFGIRTIPHNVIYDRQGVMAANVTGFVTEKDLKEYISTLLEQKKK